MLDGDGELVFHLGKIRVVGSGEAQDIKIGVAAAEMDHLFVIGGKGDHVVGHPANDITEQPGVEHDITAIGDIGGHPGADAGLHIVAGNGQIVVGMQKQAFQCGNGAFLSHCPAGDGNGALEKGFLAGKFHHRNASSLIGIDGGKPL